MNERQSDFGPASNPAGLLAILIGLTSVTNTPTTALCLSLVSVSVKKAKHLLMVFGSVGLCLSSGSAGSVERSVIDTRVPQLTSATNTLDNCMWTRAQLRGGASTFYGLGWDLRNIRSEKAVSHGGGLPGFSKYIARFVDRRLTIIVLTNLENQNVFTIVEAIAGFYLTPLPDPK